MTEAKYVVIFYHLLGSESLPPLKARDLLQLVACSLLKHLNGLWLSLEFLVVK